MAIGKNKKLGKKVKKGSRKIIDPFSKKEWYDIRTPGVFDVRNIGKTVITKTIGQKQARDGLLGRIFDVSLADLKTGRELDSFRQFRLRVEDVQGSNCLTGFYGLTVTSDKLKSLVKKWHTLIEAFTDVKTTDGYLVRVFVIGFTKKRQDQIRKTSYAQTGQIKIIRKKMIEIIQREVSSGDSIALTQKLISEVLGNQIERATEAIYPLQNVLVRKVKLLKGPKLDAAKIAEIHTAVEAPAAKPDTGKTVERAEKKTRKTKNE